MPRLPVITQRDQVPPEHGEQFDAIVERRGSVVGPFRILLHSPKLARMAADVGAYLRYDSGLPRDVAELAIITAAREWDCRYVWGDHAPLARQAGISEETIQAVAGRKAPAGLRAEEAQVVGYVHQLLRQHRSDAALHRALEDRLGKVGLVELTVMLGYYSMLAQVLNGYEVDQDPDKERLPD